MARRARFDKDYYRIMDLRPETTEDEIRKAYRRLALQWHPDRNGGDPRATERFKEISEAYAVLIDPAKRHQYDAARQNADGTGFSRSQEDLLRDLFADPRASTIFEELSREFARIGMRVDRHYFHQTLFGGRAVISGGLFVITPLTPLLTLLRVGMRRRATASAHAGRARTLPGPRDILTGLGQVGRWFLGLPSAPGPEAPSEADLVLPLCLTPIEAERGGRKRVTLDGDRGGSDLLVTVPPGTQTGSRLRLRGRGRISATGNCGDLYLAVEIIS